MTAATMLLALAFLAGCDGPAGEVRETGETGALAAMVPACVDPVPILTAAGTPTGYVRCADGGVDRVEALPLVPEAYSAAIEPCDPSWDGSCDIDAECTAAPGGRCTTVRGLYRPVCACTYVCASDADCGFGEVCVAPETFALPLAWPVCVPATCRTGALCAAERCGLFALHDCGLGEVTLRCRQPDDACLGPDDCPDSNSDRNCWAYEQETACVKDACD